MISILPQECLDICFDTLAGSLRPQWEAGPNDNHVASVNKNPAKTQATTAIHGHIFYLEQLNELLDYGNNIPNRYFLLNTDCDWKAETIQKIVDSRKEKHVEIKVLPNRGRDLGSLLVGWRDRLNEFELVAHCHTKKTPHAPNTFGDTWRNSLMRGTFPNTESCIQLQNILSRPDSGIVMPWPHKFVAHNVNWGKNFSQTRKLMKLMGYEVKRDTLLAFPAGSFFWGRVDCLKPLLDLGLRWDDFEKEPLPNDGRLAHALERCLGLVPMLSGRNCYVHWGGSGCHDLPNGPEKSAIIPLPNPSLMTAHSQTWFRMGWMSALTANRKHTKQSVALQRRLPELKRQNHQPMKLNFMIAGTQKAGTTALADYIRNHPQVHLPSKKELHFFDDEQQNWPNADFESLHENFQDAEPGQLWGEATPITMYWERCAERIWSYNPAMQMVVMLRDPVDRAYSHWAMETKRGMETLPFSEAVKLEHERARTALPLQDRVHSYIDRSRYCAQIQRLWRWFGRGNVLIIRHEELNTKPQDTIDKVCRFLSIDKIHLNNHIIANKGEYKENLDQNLRNQLIKTLRGEILSLELMLGWDCSDWLEVKK